LLGARTGDHPSQREPLLCGAPDRGRCRGRHRSRLPAAELRLLSLSTAARLAEPIIQPPPSTGGLALHHRSYAPRRLSNGRPLDMGRGDRFSFTKESFFIWHRVRSRLRRRKLPRRWSFRARRSRALSTGPTAAPVSPSPATRALPRARTRPSAASAPSAAPRATAAPPPRAACPGVSILNFVMRPGVT
jgi:hypothetical protein